MRNKKRDRLYISDPGGVVFRPDAFPRHLRHSGDVPVGLYTATVFLLRDGKVVESIASPLYIDKSGLERFIYRVT